jgi:hypothetical protein
MHVQEGCKDRFAGMGQCVEEKGDETEKLRRHAFVETGFGRRKQAATGAWEAQC